MPYIFILKNENKWKKMELWSLWYYTVLVRMIELIAWWLSTLCIWAVDLFWSSSKAHTWNTFFVTVERIRNSFWLKYSWSEDQIKLCLHFQSFWLGGWLWNQNSVSLISYEAFCSGALSHFPLAFSHILFLYPAFLFVSHLLLAPPCHSIFLFCYYSSGWVCFILYK